jgi:hypothetical protein
MGSIGTSMLAEAPALIDSGIQAFGGKKADDITGGEELFSKGTDAAFKASLQTGNP